MENFGNHRHINAIKSSFKEFETVEVEISKAIETSIEKSHIHDQLGQTEIVEKTGKEVKESIKGVKDKELQEATTHLLKANAYKEQIKESPTEEVYEWNYRGTKYYFPFEPKTYSNINHGNTTSVSESSNKIVADSQSDVMGVAETPNTDPTVPTVDDFKVMYNQCINKYVECFSEAIKLDIMERNLTDSKKLKLTLDQATALGL